MSTNHDTRTGLRVLLAASAVSSALIARTTVGGLPRRSVRAPDTSIVAAAEKLDVRTVRRLIARGANVNVKNAQGDAALHWAAYKGSAELTRVLIDAGADLDALQSGGRTPLLLAASVPHAAAAKLLVEAGADVNIQDKNGDAPLHWAAKHGATDLVRALIRARAKLDVLQGGGFTPLNLAASVPHVETAKALIKAGADPSLQAENRDAPLHWAAHHGSVELTSALIQARAKLNMRQAAERTPLILAASVPHEDVAKRLIAAGADVNIQDKHRDAALHWAADKGSLALTERLLDAGARIDVRQSVGRTPLILAALGARVDVAKLLIARGADVNVQDNNGDTALHWAAEKNAIELCRVLVRQGARRDILNVNNTTAEGVAKAKGHSAALAAIQTTKVQPVQARPIVGSGTARPVGSAAVSAGPGQKWAVVVGISRYRDSRIEPLRYAAADAKAFGSWLTSPQGGRYAPSRVQLLLDERATVRNIREALFTWLKQAIAEDTVVIYFAGHGSPESPDSGENLFLLPYDVQYDSIAATGFPMWDIETALRRFIKAKRVVVLADACHAGGVGASFDIARRSSRGLRPNAISAGLHGLTKIAEGVCVITASDASQLSQEGSQWGGGHGVFTHFLLEGLKGNADYSRDGSVTLGELVPYLSEQVRRATHSGQSPTVAGKFDPALTLGR